MSHSRNHGRVLQVCAGAVLGVVFGWSALASAQTQVPAGTNTVPDAQVEADVLRALAGTSDLADQAITTTTVYGVVTLSGSVQTEALRVEAETIASKTSGVKKVVDEMTLNSSAAPPAQDSADGGSSVADSQGTSPNLQSDGTMAPPQGDAQGTPPADYPNAGQGAPEYRRPYRRQQAQGQPQGYNPPQTYYGAPAYAGQQAGESVTIPNGALVRIRISQTLDSARTRPGERFEGIVVNDIAGGGAIAIPRGAAVQGVVVSAKKSGALSGRGELSLQLTSVMMAGQSYPIVSDVWAHNGADKSVQTVNSTAVGGGMGALVGAAVGGGAGAAIGAGIGGLLGLGSSAASHAGQVFVPAEGLLTFHLAQPATVATVSQQEMDRLSQGVPAGAGPQHLQRRYPPPYGPVYYRPYPYPY